MGDPVTDGDIERARVGYRKFREGDPSAFDNWDPEVEIHVPKAIPGGGGVPINVGSEARALTGRAARHLVRAALRVTDLRRGRVAGALQAAVDRVRDVLVAVGVLEDVVVQVHRAVHVVADEPEPEAVV